MAHRRRRRSRKRRRRRRLRRSRSSSGGRRRSRPTTRPTPSSSTSTTAGGSRTRPARRRLRLTKKKTTKQKKTKHSQHSIPFPVQSRVRMVHSILGRDHNIGDVLEHPSPSIVGRSCSSKPISTNCSGHFRRFFSTAGLVYETCAELWNLT